MKLTYMFLFLLIGAIAYGQSKFEQVPFDRLTEVAGTEYVIASTDHSKMAAAKNDHLLFINSLTNEITEVGFSNGAHIGKLEQVKIDGLGINWILLSAKTVDLDGKIGIDRNDPMQIIVFSPDGKQRKQLTDDALFVKAWVVNTLTGTITISGHYDSNKNNKHDGSDKNTIQIYDLKELKMIFEM